MNAATSWAARIDHVVVVSSDVSATMGWFQDVLGLPLAWPLTRWLEVPEGGVAGGNCNIGVCAGAPSASTVLASVALDPLTTAEQARRELSERGFDPSPLQPSGEVDVPDDDEHRPWNAGWIDVTVPAWPETPAPFVCEYRHDRRARRQGEARRFADRDDHGVGVLGVASVVVHSNDPGTTLQRWIDALAPVRVDGGVLTLGDGPVLEVREGEGPGALVFAVAEPSRARWMLGERGVGSIEVDGREEWRLVDDRLGSLDLRISP